MSNIVKYETMAPVSIGLQDAITAGKIFAESGFFSDARGMAQAVTKIMAGDELGFPPIVSLTGSHLIKRSGKYDYRIREHNEKVCRVEFLQGRESLGASSFTAEDARRAGTQNLDK